MVTRDSEAEQASQHAIFFAPCFVIGSNPVHEMQNYVGTDVAYRNITGKLSKGCESECFGPIEFAK
jgi:hypothetical protein